MPAARQEFNPQPGQRSVARGRPVAAAGPGIPFAKSVPAQMAADADARRAPNARLDVRRFDFGASGRLPLSFIKFDVSVLAVVNREARCTGFLVCS